MLRMGHNCRGGCLDNCRVFLQSSTNFSTFAASAVLLEELGEEMCRRRGMEGQEEEDTVLIVQKPIQSYPADRRVWIGMSE